MAKQDFINQLIDLGFDPSEPRPDFITFNYKIEVGPHLGKEVRIGFQVNGSFPANAPHGPHFNVHLKPITGGGGIHPNGGIHRSPLGPEWQHWSRPFQEWSKTDRSVKTYLSHIKNLLV